MGTHDDLEDKTLQEVDDLLDLLSLFRQPVHNLRVTSHATVVDHVDFAVVTESALNEQLEELQVTVVD